MSSGANPQTRPTIGRLSIYFIFSWLVALVCTTSLVINGMELIGYEAPAGFSIRHIIWSIVLGVLRYAPGAFVLGVLIGERIRAWALGFVYIIPSFIHQVAIFASTTISESMKAELLKYPVFMIYLPIVFQILAPFIAFHMIRIGSYFYSDYTRINSVFDIHWLHWMWILPLSLFQVVGVPFFLFIVFFKINVVADSISTPFAPLIIFRVIIFGILAGVVKLIQSAYSALVDDDGSVKIRIFKVVGVWILLTAMQGIIILYIISRIMSNQNG